MHVAWARHDMFFISHMCKNMCAHRIDNVKPIIQSSRVYTRHVHDSLQTHACMSGMHTPNLNYVCMQIVNQGQQNKLFDHVHILWYDFPRDTRCKSR